MLGCCAILSALPTLHQNPDAVVIHGALLFDGTRFIQGQEVLIEDAKIAEVAARVRAPTSAKWIDASGKTLLPGLIDSHTHTYGDGLEATLHHGVTTHVDMFSAHFLLKSAREHRERLMPTKSADLFSAGTLVTVSGGHGTQFGLSIPTLENAADAKDFVAKRKAEGSDFIKLVIEDGSAHGRSLPTLDRERVQAIVQAAHEEKLLALAHVSTLEGAKMAVSSGVDGLVHIFHDAPVDDAFLNMVKGRPFFVIPTLTVIEKMTGNLKNSIASVRRLHAEGVAILAGTDAPNPGTTYGRSLHRELELLHRAGLSLEEALASATSLPAKWLPLGKRGRIQKDYRADLLFIEGNLRKDLSATRKIARLFKNGYEVKAKASSSEHSSEKTRLMPGLISDFEEGRLLAKTGFGWQETSDKMMGGASRLSHSIVNESTNASVRIDADVQKGFQIPWAGLIYFPGKKPMAPADVSAAKAVRFRARGDAGRYRLMYFVQGQNMPITKTFNLEPQWKFFRIELPSLLQSTPLLAIAWVAGPEPGRVTFWLDDVALEPLL